MAETRELDSAYARFEFNPLERRPVVLTQKPIRCVVPSLSSLLVRFTDGIYHDFFNYYRLLGNPETFTIPFGRVFEEYVGWQLRSHYGEGLVIPERTYKIGKDEWRGPDWIALEGNRAIVIECKAARLTLSGKVTAAEDAIEDDVRSKLVQVIMKFSQKIAHIRARPDIYPELRDACHFYSVVVTLDPWWPAQTFHQAIQEELSRRGASSEPFHVISIGALEILLPLAAAGGEISAVLQERIDKGQQGFFLGEEVSTRFREAGGVKSNKLLEEARKDFFAPLTSCIIDSG